MRQTIGDLWVSTMSKLAFLALIVFLLVILGIRKLLLHRAWDQALKARFSAAEEAFCSIPADSRFRQSGVRL